MTPSLPELSTSSLAERVFESAAREVATEHMRTRSDNLSTDVETHVEDEEYLQIGFFSGDRPSLPED
jgi:hypothetical protein